MTTEQIPAERSTHTEPYADSRPAERLPSIGTMIAFATLPVVTIMALSFPVVAAVGFAAIFGGTVGVVLHRRYPNAVDRRVRLPSGGELRDS